MAIIVQKFGGSSVKSPERMKKVAERAISEKAEGNQVVVVVSAMGDQTNQLIDLYQEVSSSSCGREKDLLLSTGEQVSCALMALALQSKGAEAIAMTGQQAGIETECVYGNAKIAAVHTDNIKDALEKGSIVVVAGFQGCAANGDICTLGRGGSDTTAAALAAALKAERCDIFTDVDGVYNADPRIIRGAIKFRSMDYEWVRTMAEMGAGVIHPRAVAHAQQYNVPLVVRSSFSKEEGTVIHRRSEDGTFSSIAGMTVQNNLSSIRLSMDGTKEEFSPRIDDSVLVGLAYAQERKEKLVVMKEEDLEMNVSLLNDSDVSLEIEEADTMSGLAAVHVVFASREEKRKRLSYMEYGIPTGLEEALIMDSHPSVWSFLLPEEKCVEGSRVLYEWMIGGGELAMAYGS